MVTFICEYCDVTLKKKQCDSHVLGRCRPGSLICIDCSKTFRGNDYKAHVTCISEVDKHWGQYAPSQLKNGTNPNHHNGQNAQHKKEQNKVVADNISQQAEQQSAKNWKGWKNQIKRAIVEESPEQRKINLQSLKKTVLKRYHEQFDKAEKDQALFLQKLQKLKKVKVETFVTLN